MWFQSSITRKKQLVKRICKLLRLSTSMKKTTIELDKNTIEMAEDDKSSEQCRSIMCIEGQLYDVLVEEDRFGCLYGISLDHIIAFMLKHDLFWVVSMMFQRLKIKSRLQSTSAKRPRPYHSILPDAKKYWIQFFERIEEDIRCNGFNT